MSKQKLQKQLLLINESLESYFSKLKSFIKDIKKFKFSPYNRVFFASGILAILTLIYLLIPTLYNKNIIKSQIKDQIINKYDINIKFNSKIKYRLLPKPHFVAENLSLIGEEEEIAIAKNFKVYFALNKFFNFNKIEIKNLVFKNIEFNIKSNDFTFFLKFLDTEPNENKVLISNGNIFFKNNDNDVLFINKIRNSSFFYDQKNSENVLILKNEIFNIPFKFEIRKDKLNKKIITKFISKKIRLNIENDLYYNRQTKNGSTNISFINKSTSFEYQIKNDSLDFYSKDIKNNYKGVIDFKPFYVNAKFNYDSLSSKNLFKDNSFLIDLTKSGILNNKNINLNIDLNVMNITNIDELNSLYLKIVIDEGNIGFSNSTIMWKDNLKIVLKESLLSNESNQIFLTGSFILNFKEIDKFYKSFQIPKTNRKKINQIKIDFLYNLNTQKITFDNIKVDNVQNSKLEKYISNFNLSENRIFNKIKFKNFVNNFFASYAG